MRVENLRYGRHGDWPAVVGTVIWETAARAPMDIYIAVAPRHRRHLRIAPEAFVAACIFPAMIDREERLTVDRPVCPIFLDGLYNIIDVYKHWYSDTFPVRLEMSLAQSLPQRAAGGATGQFFSGGMDSRYTLYRWNSGLLPEHPGRVRYGFLVDFHEFRRHYPDFVGRYDLRHAIIGPADVARQAKVTDAMGAELILVRSNITMLNDDSGFWVNALHGAAFAAVSHTVSRGLTRMLLASANVNYKKGLGSHPLTDNHWSSARLDFILDTSRITRFQKTKELMDWPLGYEGMQICVNHNSPLLNCGRCEKCLRTALMMILCGQRLEVIFPYAELRPDDLGGIHIDRVLARDRYARIARRLHRIDRNDLAERIEMMVAAYDAAPIG